MTSLNALGLERSTEEGSYVLTVNHILTDGGEMWGKEETIELTEEDFTNGVLNTAPYEYVKDGMELAGKAPVVRATDFQGEDGAYELTVDMEYRVMDGWHIVRETAQPGIMLMAIYIGELDDVDIVQDANQIPVYVRYLDENGVTVKSAETIMAEKADTCLLYTSSWVLTKEQIPQQLTNWMMTVITNKYVFLIVVNVFLLIVGMFIEGNASMIILVPLLAPIAANYGIDEIQFAMIYIFNNAIGALSPPMGTLMFVTCSITKCKTAPFIKEAVPFYILLLINLMLLTWFEPFTTLLVDLFY